jgi:hypothetical protein
VLARLRSTVASRRAVVGCLLLVGLATAGCTGAGGSAERASGPCTGVTLGDVRGPQPDYVRGELDPFPGSDAVCRALWLPRADRWFVPQGVALDGRTAWVSGYRWRAGYGNRPCRLLHVDLRTGRLLGDQPRLDGAVPDGPPVFCHHGGGLAMDEHGLWVAETRRLWLVDPARVGHPDAVRRVWRLDRPVSGGLLVTGREGRFGLGDFSLTRDSGMHWFRFADLLAPGVTTLGAEPAGPSRVPALRRTVAPRYAQGGAVDPDGPRAAYLTTSLSTCGLLLTPDGRALALGPGAEGIAFDGHGGLWAVLESGARSYQEQGRPLVPMLVRYDVDQLLAGPEATCDW